MFDSMRRTRLVLIALTVGLAVLSALVVSSGARAHTGLVAESFGTTAQSVVTGWDEIHLDPPFGDADDCGIATTSPRPGSPTVGNAYTGNGCRLTRSFDTTGHEDITISFYCRGDTDAASNDRLQVVADLDGDGEVFETILGNFTVDEPESDCPEDAWSDQYSFDLSAIDPVVNDSSFNLLVTGQVIQVPDRDFRIDDIVITGSDIGGPAPTPTFTPTVMPSDTPGPTAPGPTATAPPVAATATPAVDDEVSPVALPDTGGTGPGSAASPSWLPLVALAGLAATGAGFALARRRG